MRYIRLWFVPPKHDRVKDPMAPQANCSFQKDVQRKPDDHSTVASDESQNGAVTKPIFIDLMLGTPLVMYVDHSVMDHNTITETVIVSERLSESVNCQCFTFCPEVWRRRC